MKTYEWTQEQISNLPGKKVRVPGALCRPGPTADQDLKVVSATHDPNYRGGAYVRFAPERYQSQPPGGCLAVGLLDPSTVQDIPKPPPESLDGLHDEREKEIRRLRDLLSEWSVYETASELVALEVKQVAQRYEARIEQRVKDEVENRTRTIRTDALAEAEKKCAADIERRVSDEVARRTALRREYDSVKLQDRIDLFAEREADLLAKLRKVFDQVNEKISVMADAFDAFDDAYDVVIDALSEKLMPALGYEEGEGEV